MYRYVHTGCIEVTAQHTLQLYSSMFDDSEGTHPTVLVMSSVPLPSPFLLPTDNQRHFIYHQIRGKGEV